MKKGAVLDITIEKLAFGGLGIANVEGLKVFVADTVPGDKAQIRITKKKQNYAEGKLVTLLTPSPKRIAAKCKHFTTCGGCTWQFLSYEDQLFYKEQIVKESLNHIGGFTDIATQPIIGCNSPWQYRNKMDFSFAVSADGIRDIGLHPKGYHYDVFPLTECHLPPPRYAEIVQALRSWIQTYNIDIYEQRKNSGLLRSVVVRHNQAHEILINFITNSGTIPYQTELKKFLAQTDIIGVLHTEINAQLGKPTTRKATLLWGKDHLEETLELRKPWQSLNFSIYPEAFFQPNPKQAAVLYAEALDQANITAKDIVLDLYCGTGTLGLFSSRLAAQVIGIDNVPDAIKSAEQNAQKNHITNAQFHVGDAAAVLSKLKIQPTIAIVDPPRAGMTPDTIDLLTQLPLQKIVYISCNPTTQARDVKMLVAQGYSVQRIQPVDMFPHTYHIENIAVLTREQ